MSLGAIVVFSLFAIKPTVITIIGLTKEINAKEDTIAKMDTKIANLREAQNIYYQQKEAIDLLDLAIPSNPSPEIFARQLEGLSSIDSVIPNSILFIETTIKGENTLSTLQDEAVTSLPNNTLAVGVNYNGSGNYDSVRNFITNLENLLRLIKVDSFGLSKTPAAEGERANNDMQITIKGRVPFYNMGSQTK